MSGFPGFPKRMKYTGIPALFFRELLPQINDLIELKATLYALHYLSSKRGFPRFVTLAEMLADGAVLAAFSGGPSPAAELRRGLGQGVERGALLALELESRQAVQTVFFLNTERDREAVAMIRRGELALSIPTPDGIGWEMTPLPQAPSNIFTLYEQNIGLIESPVLADQLRDAEETYPAEWIQEAIAEAVSQNVRKWSYVESILKRWATEGRGGTPWGEEHGTLGRLPKTTIDSKKHGRGPYGPLFRE